MKLFLSCYIFFILFSVSGISQSLNHIKFISEKHYIIDREKQYIIDEQDSTISFSIVDDVIILEQYGEMIFLEIIEVAEMPFSSFNYRLEGNQYFILSEENMQILFGFQEMNLGILYDISEKQLLKE